MSRPRRDPTWPLPDSPDSPVYAEILERARRGDWRMFVLQALNDFWFFARWVSSVGKMLCGDTNLPEHYGKPWLDHRWLFDRCREIQASPDGHLDLWPRFHFKTTLITILFTIWELADNPNLRFAFITNKIAKSGESFLGGVKKELERNAEMYSSVFWWAFWRDPGSDCRRAKVAWSEEEITVMREDGAREPSIIVGSLEAGLTSGHYDRRVWDDLVTEMSVASREQIQVTTQRWRDFAGTAADDTKDRYVGTHWAVNDTYRDILDLGAAKLRRHDVIDKDGKPVLRSREWLEKMYLHMGPYGAACQLRNSPVQAGLQTFNIAWFRYDDVEPKDRRRRTRVYILADTAGSKKLSMSRRQSDYNQMIVVGLGRGVPRGKVYVHDAVRDRMGLVRFGEELFRLVELWRPEYVFLEQFGAARDGDYLRQRMIDVGLTFKLIEFSERLPKEARIQRLQPLFAAGDIIFPRYIGCTTDERRHNWVESFKNDEYSVWDPAGGARYDDGLDTLAQLTSPELRPYLRFPDNVAGTIEQENVRLQRRHQDRLKRRASSPWAI